MLPMMPSKNVKKQGFVEVIYLDAVEHKYIEEVGAANFCVKDGEIFTPELTGTILPGITRASVIELARQKGYIVHEEKVSASFAMDADEAFCLEQPLSFPLLVQSLTDNTNPNIITEI